MKDPVGNSGKDNPIVVFAVLTAVTLFIGYTLYNSPAMYKATYLPWLHLQSKIYAFIFPSAYKKEYEEIKKIILTVNNIETHNKNLSKINKNLPKKHRQQQIIIDIKKLKTTTSSVSPKTRLTTKIITACILVPTGFLKISLHIKMRKKILSQNENLNIQTNRGLEGFIDIITPYVEPEILESVKKNPTPQNLALAFSRARHYKNIPNNLAGRMFPSFSEERLSILEVGKEKIYKRNIEEDIKNDKTA